jgi:uncharacterized Zn-binding protein involved in type VI secretion
MGNPAARVGDMHTCPMVTPGLPPVPHVGGPVLPPGVPLVLIGSLPSVTIGNMCTCVGPPDIISMGSTSVLIGGRFSSRQLDNTAHGGIISVGLPTVLIGGPASVTSLKISAVNKTWWGKILGIFRIDAGNTGTIKYGNIVINPNPNDPEFQGKVLGDLIMLNNTPTGTQLLESLNNAGGATIKSEHKYMQNGIEMTATRNCCFTKESPPIIVYNPDTLTSTNNPTQAWQTRPPAIALAHEMIHADHSANGSLYKGLAPNDAKPNPVNPGITQDTQLEELHTVGVFPNDGDRFTENKIRNDWFTAQPQRLWY